MMVKARKETITNPGKAAMIFETILKSENAVDRDKEHFWTVGLDTHNTIVYVELVSLGTLNASLVHPRETFRMAIMKGVASLFIAHNHPSGSLEPSQDDQALTRRLREAGHLLGIEVLDHLIIGKSKYMSFKEKGLI